MKSVLNNLQCPFCENVLLNGGKRRYESVIDHVLSYDIECVPFRDIYVCTCIESQGLFWDGLGMYYLTVDRTDLFGFGNKINAIVTGG